MRSARPSDIIPIISIACFCSIPVCLCTAISCTTAFSRPSACCWTPTCRYPKSVTAADFMILRTSRNILRKRLGVVHRHSGSSDLFIFYFFTSSLQSSVSNNANISLGFSTFWLSVVLYFLHFSVKKELVYANFFSMYFFSQNISSIIRLMTVRARVPAMQIIFDRNGTITLKGVDENENNNQRSY